MIISKIANLVSIYSVLIPLIIGIFYIRRYRLTDKLVLLLIITACIPQLASAIDIGKENLFILYNLYTIVDAIIWGGIFYINLNTSNKKYILILVSVFSILFGHFNYTTGINQKFFSELVCADSFIQIILVLIFFYQEFKNDRLFAIELTPLFWYCIAILIYAPSTYFLFAFREFINDALYEYSVIWILHDIFNTIFYILIAYGMIKTIKYKSIIGS